MTESVLGLSLITVKGSVVREYAMKELLRRMSEFKKQLMAEATAEAEKLSVPTGSLPWRHRSFNAEERAEFIKTKYHEYIDQWLETDDIYGSLAKHTVAWWAVARYIDTGSFRIVRALASIPPEHDDQLIHLSMNDARAIVYQHYEHTNKTDLVKAVENV